MAVMLPDQDANAGVGREDAIDALRSRDDRHQDDLILAQTEVQHALDHVDHGAAGREHGVGQDDVPDAPPTDARLLLEVRGGLERLVIAPDAQVVEVADAMEKCTLTEAQAGTPGKTDDRLGRGQLEPHHGLVDEGFFDGLRSQAEVSGADRPLPRMQVVPEDVVLTFPVGAEHRKPTRREVVVRDDTLEHRELEGRELLEGGAVGGRDEHA